MTYSEINACRISNSKNLVSLVNLGKQTLTGVFLKPEEEDPIAVPLDLVFCPESLFLQLRYDVDPDLMYSSYWYRSGTNQTMRDHLQGVVASVKTFVELNDGDYVIDTGCNDGTLVRNYNLEKLNVIGVDPSNAIDNIKDDENITKINNYFTAENVENAIGGNKVKAITSISMFYDLSNPASFINDVKSILADDGVWVVEMNYTGDMIEDLGYDMISHEHVAYYTFLSFERLIKSCGMHISDVSANTINGGSLRFFITKNAIETQAVKDVRNKELAMNYDKIESYQKFGSRIEAFKLGLQKFINGLNADGKTIMGYGGSTRGNTVMQHCGFTRKDVVAVWDRNPIKWGLEMSGCRIPLISEEEGRKLNPDYLLILPYYFLEEFLDREIEYLKNGGKFIVYLPVLRVISWQDGVLVEDVISE